MKALILAAGDGERLKEVTKGRVPKPLVKLLGLTLIERVILTAKRAGIDEFVIVLGYKGWMIRKKLGDGSGYGVKISYVENKEWKKENGISALKAKKLMNERFVLLMSDHIFDFHILKGLLKHKTRSSVVLVVDRREAGPEDTKVLEKEGKIVDIGKDIKESNCVDTGIFLCSPKVFSYLESAVKKGKTRLSDGISMAAKCGDAEVFDVSKMKTYVPFLRKSVKAFWVDVDNKEDMERAEKILVENASKGTNDILATYVNKPIENFIVRKVANSWIKPSHVTLITNILAYIIAFLFLKGYLLLASILTFVVSFIDGVDGKLARVRMSFSKLGKMEHPFDFLHEQVWYIVLAIFLSHAYGNLPLMLCILILLFNGLYRYTATIFENVTNVCLHDYGRAERIFRRFDGRRNTYIIFILLGVLSGKLLWSLMAIFLWSVASAFFYMYRAMIHLHNIDKGK